MVTSKVTVQFLGITRALCRILDCLCQVSEELKLDVLITSGSDGKHMVGSKHYTFQAVDIRSKTYTKDKKMLFIQELKSFLGPSFTVLLENEGTPNEHIHLQLKKGLTGWPM